MKLDLTFDSARIRLPNHEWLEIEIQKIDTDSYVLVVCYGAFTPEFKTYSADANNPFLTINLETGELE